MGKDKRFIGLDKDGFEHPDPTPVEMPTRLRLPQRQVDRVREIIRRELSDRAREEGWESFDEADDFDLPGEDPISPYEEVFEPVVVESPVPQVAADKGDGNVDTDRKGSVVGQRKASGDLGAGRGDKDVGAAGGKADVSAGSNGGAGSASARSEGASR